MYCISQNKSCKLRRSSFFAIANIFTNRFFFQIDNGWSKFKRCISHIISIMNIPPSRSWISHILRHPFVDCRSAIALWCWMLHPDDECFVATVLSKWKPVHIVEKTLSISNEPNQTWLRLFRHLASFGTSLYYSFALEASFRFRFKI